MMKRVAWRAKRSLARTALFPLLVLSLSCVVSAKADDSRKPYYCEQPQGHIEVAVCSDAQLSLDAVQLQFELQDAVEQAFDHDKVTLADRIKDAIMRHEEGLDAKCTNGAQTVACVRDAQNALLHKVEEMLSGDGLRTLTQRSVEEDKLEATRAAQAAAERAAEASASAPALEIKAKLSQLSAPAAATPITVTTQNPSSEPATPARRERLIVAVATGLAVLLMLGALIKWLIGAGRPARTHGQSHVPVKAAQASPVVDGASSIGATGNIVRQQAEQPAVSSVDGDASAGSGSGSVSAGVALSGSAESGASGRAPRSGRELESGTPSLQPPHATAPRHVSLVLALALVFAPLVGAWFTLREGYSRKVRVFAFGWLLLLLVVAGQDKNNDVTDAAASSAGQEFDFATVEKMACSNIGANLKAWDDAQFVVNENPGSPGKVLLLVTATNMFFGGGEWTPNGETLSMHLVAGVDRSGAATKLPGDGRRMTVTAVDRTGNSSEGDDMIRTHGTGVNWDCIVIFKA